MNQDDQAETEAHDPSWTPPGTKQKKPPARIDSRDRFAERLANLGLQSHDGVGKLGDVLGRARGGDDR